MKKAQMMSQPLYYVFILIVIALIFFFGFKMIKGVLDTQEQAKCVEFKIGLESYFNNIYALNPGTKISYELSVPKDATRVKFKDENNGKRISIDSGYCEQSFYLSDLKGIREILVKKNKVSFTLENIIVSQKTVIKIS